MRLHAAWLLLLLAACGRSDDGARASLPEAPAPTAEERGAFRFVPSEFATSAHLRRAGFPESAELRLTEPGTRSAAYAVADPPHCEGRVSVYVHATPAEAREQFLTSEERLRPQVERRRPVKGSWIRSGSAPWHVIAFDEGGVRSVEYARQSGRLSVTVFLQAKSAGTGAPALETLELRAKALAELLAP